jgi:mRNA-degrading endonuclease RelE of RelBE toxin-antitoxin system
MSSEPSAPQIELTPEFQKRLSSLAKRFRNIRSDIQSVVEELKAGGLPGDRIAGVGEESVVFKVRIRNSNLQKGKSAGYRLIYQVESDTNILFLTIYSKSDQEDISTDEIIEILRTFYQE